MTKATEKGSAVRQLAVGDVIATRDNPRVINRKDPEFVKLVDSIREIGVLIPVHVRAHPRKKGKWDLRAGERRLLAAGTAGRKSIPAIVHEKMSDDAAFELTFVENFAREDLTPVEESKAVATLMKRFKEDVRAVAAKLGHTEKWVRLRARLQKLTKPWLTAMRNASSAISSWSPAHLDLIARFPDVTQNRILEDLRHRRHMTVRELEGWLNEHILRRLSSAPWDLEDRDLVKKALACTTCPNRSSRQAELFHDDTSAEALARDDRCLDERCWNRKADAFVARRLAELKKEHPDLLPVVGDNARLGWERQKALEKRHGKLSYFHSLNVVKEGTKGARPALIVAGDRAGETKWVTAKTYGAARTAKRSTGVTVPLEQRKHAHWSKRWTLVLTVLEKKVRTLSYADLPKVGGELAELKRIVALARVFGTDRNEGLGYPAKKVAHVKGLRARKLCELLWYQVRPVIASTVHHRGNKTDVPTTECDNARAVGRLCGIDVGMLLEDAVKALPDPKGWKKLEAAKAEARKKSRKKGAAKKTAKKTGKKPVKKPGKKRRRMVRTKR